jgi:hypothetical protein
MQSTVRRDNRTRLIPAATTPRPFGVAVSFWYRFTDPPALLAGHEARMS